MQVKSIAECSEGSILPYFQPSYSYYLSFRSLFCLFLSGPFTQILLYVQEGGVGGGGGGLVVDEQFYCVLKIMTCSL